MLGEDDEESATRKSSLKGLLKAFKGKGELQALVQQPGALRRQLSALA